MRSEAIVKRAKKSSISQADNPNQESLVRKHLTNADEGNRCVEPERVCVERNRQGETVPMQRGTKSLRSKSESREFSAKAHSKNNRIVKSFNIFLTVDFDLLL